MQLHIYRGEQLAAIFEYGKEPTYHGAAGQQVRAAVETRRAESLPRGTSFPGVPADWLAWAAAVVRPALATGAFVRWYGYSSGGPGNGAVLRS